MSDELQIFGRYREAVFPLLGGRQYSLTSDQGIPLCPNMVNAGEPHDHIRKDGSLCGC